MSITTAVVTGPLLPPTAPSMMPAAAPLVAPTLDSAARAYIDAAAGESGRRCRRRGVVGFINRYGDLDSWLGLPVQEPRDTRSDQMAFVGHALVHCHIPVDPVFVVTSGCRWGKYVADAYPEQVARFGEQAASLGYGQQETHRMWAYLAKICVTTGTAPDQITPAVYLDARRLIHDTVIAVRGYRPKTLSTPMFGLDAVMFHRGQAPPPDIRRRWTGRPAKEVTWEELTAQAPVLVATMRRYLDQCLLSLRPSSVACFDTTFRQFAAMLVAQDPPVIRASDIDRQHIEAYKTFLATRPGYHGRPLSKTTLGMRLGHLHTFFTRIIEWDYNDVPARIPVYASDRPRLDKPLPKFLDDAQAVAFMNAARQLPDPLDRLMVIALARTGMRRGELLGLTVDAVVQIGAGYWLRTPVGKLHTDRYIPLHPQLKDLLDEWIAHRPDWQATSLLLTDRGRPIPPTRVDNAVQKAATAAGIGHVHPHQLRHTLATQAINRGMSLEAIAALLGHHDLSMTMVYARIADRTVAKEYFAVTQKVEALYQHDQPAVLPAEAAGPSMRVLRNEAAKRLLGNGYCGRPRELDCQYETICESCTMFFTTIEHRDTIQAQRDNATQQGHHRRRDVYDALLAKLDNKPA
ncbi:tyrosine-type recombinase/integrase [Microbacterium sp.]|uniref:tyrosine-type recombinase/integrase n=1 Tax=Microbacterium sp. TaxID=51671 RepID=UPI0028A998BC|nr:tyrosine-type recombinase/integrase [Microbacterium sp.]